MSKKQEKTVLGEETMKRLTKKVSISKKVAKKIFFSILLLIIIFFVFAMILQQTTKMNNNNNNLLISQFDQRQIIKFNLLIKINNKTNESNKIHGRIISIKINSAENYTEALNKARPLAFRNLHDNESLWETPINNASENFPITIKWLAYRKNDLQSLIKKEIEKINHQKIKYRVEAIDKLFLDTTDQSNIYVLKVAVHLVLNELIQHNTTDQQKIEKKDIYKEKVMINNTETGWLNVRSGPGMNFNVLLKVKPGDTYLLINEEDKWYNIDVDGVDGWIFSNYATKLK